MSKRYKGGARNSRDAPIGAKSEGATSMLCSPTAWSLLCSEEGYKPLTQCPEVQTCAGVYADLIGSMTLHLMRNTAEGDVRVRNRLSHKMDIEPNRHMTRQGLMSLIVWTMMLDGAGNQITYPKYAKNGQLEDLIPLEPSKVSMVPKGDSYQIRYGEQVFNPDEVLHFVLRPNPEHPWKGMGHNVALREAVKCIRQAQATKKALLESPTPSLIVKVDGLSDEFSSRAGRESLRDQYISAKENGKPWFIPSEAFELEQVKPMTLNDLAIKPNLELDKKEVASIMGVPAFLVGVGEYKKDEFNMFVRTRVMARAQAIQQELTRKTLIAPDLYWMFNPRSLYAYDMGELVQAGAEMVDRMAMRRNEWRDWMGIPPDKEMNDLLALENYLPVDKLGSQKKLKDGGEENAE